MKNYKKLLYLRWGLLTLFTVLITLAAFAHTKESGLYPSIHALCPFGGLESLFSVFTSGTFISKIFSGTMLLFAITLVLAIAFRRSFCGLLCPFGAIQELFGKIGQKLFKRKFIMPSAIDRPLRYLKYVILFITVLYAWKTAGLWMAPYDPWSTYGHLSEGLESMWSESAIGLILLIITVIGSFVYDRFFCKYLCPMGAFYGIIGKLSPHKIKRNDTICIACGKCNKVCPVNLDVQHAQEVKSAECINCQICVLSCPKKGALEIRQGKKAIKPIVVLAMVLVIFFGSIFALQAMGVYQLKPAKITAGESIKIGELKGYMTIKESAEATKIDEKEFYEKMEIPSTVPDTTKMKEIKNIIPDYSFDEMKEKFK
jgi:polyferredoxin